MDEGKCPYRKELTDPMPARIAALPVSSRGYPVPWFVAWVNGEPEFRAADQFKFIQAIRHSLCWVCGQQMGAYKTFVVGPMCGLNRTTSEPPAHSECAIWSTLNCPFLKNPNMVRREEGLPEGVEDPAGIMIKRNPGVTLLWTTKSFKLFNDGKGGALIHMGDAVVIDWFKLGRKATKEEIEEAIESGCPVIRNVAEAEGALKEFQAAKDQFDKTWRAFYG